MGYQCQPLAQSLKMQHDAKIDSDRMLRIEEPNVRRRKMRLDDKETTLDIHWYSIPWYSPFYPVLTMSDHLNKPFALWRFQRLEDVRVDAKGSFRQFLDLFEQTSWTKKFIEIHSGSGKVPHQVAISSGFPLMWMLSWPSPLFMMPEPEKWTVFMHFFLRHLSSNSCIYLVNRSPNPAIRARCNKADGRFFDATTQATKQGQRAFGPMKDWRTSRCFSYGHHG